MSAEKSSPDTAEVPGTPDSALTPETEMPAEAKVVALEAALAEAEQAAAQAREAQLRAVAELENTRRRLEREAHNSVRFAAESLLRDLLAVADSLELGLKAAEAADAGDRSIADGMALTQRQLAAVLEKQGVRPINPEKAPFNPDLHQAMSMVETAEVAPNHVLSVMQKGYQLHERLLRPAMVVVAKAPAAPAEEPS